MKDILPDVYSHDEDMCTYDSINTLYKWCLFSGFRDLDLYSQLHETWWSQANCLHTGCTGLRAETFITRVSTSYDAKALMLMLRNYLRIENAPSRTLDSPCFLKTKLLASPHRRTGCRVAGNNRVIRPQKAGVVSSICTWERYQGTGSAASATGNLDLST